MVWLWDLFTLTRRRNILATYLGYIRRYVNQYSIPTTYEFIIKWHGNANWDIKHRLQIPITNNGRNSISIPTFICQQYFDLHFISHTSVHELSSKSQRWRRFLFHMTDGVMLTLFSLQGKPMICIRIFGHHTKTSNYNKQSNR